jgi:hypothetical protein
MTKGLQKFYLYIVSPIFLIYYVGPEKGHLPLEQIFAPDFWLRRIG